MTNAFQISSKYCDRRVENRCIQGYHLKRLADSGSSCQRHSSLVQSSPTRRRVCTWQPVGEACTNVIRNVSLALVGPVLWVGAVVVRRGPTAALGVHQPCHHFQGGSIITNCLSFTPERSNAEEPPL